MDLAHVQHQVHVDLVDDRVHVDDPFGNRIELMERWDERSP